MLLARSRLMEDCREAERCRARCRPSTRRPISRTTVVDAHSIRLATQRWRSIRFRRAASRRRSRARFPAPSSPTPWFGGPKRADLAMGFYRAQLSDASERHRRWAADHYATAAASARRPLLGRALGETRGGGRPLHALEPIDAGAMAAMSVELSPEAAFVDTPCLDGDFVGVAPALRHPGLESPVAYLGGGALAPLLRNLARRPHAVADRARMVEPDAARIRARHRRLARQPRRPGKGERRRRPPVLTSTLTEWLTLHELERFTPLFEQNEVDLQTLRLLTDDDLKELGLPFGPRKRILSLLGEERQLEKSSAPAAVVGAPAGERRQLTVLFCDMVGFTKLAHRLDPEALQGVVRAYEDACATCVNRYDGYVFTTLGDGVVAFFGYPLAHEGEAERAIRAGLDIVEAMAALQIRDAGRLQVRIGIATGMVVVASGERNAVGETMNLASRLQTIARPGTVIVSERVRRLSEGLFEYEDMGERELKGVTAPTHVYRVLGVTEAESRFDAASQSGLTPLVGREDEVGTLVARLEKRARKRRRTNRASARRGRHRQEPDHRHAARAPGRGGQADAAVPGLAVLCQQRVLSDQDLVRANAGAEPGGRCRTRGSTSWRR